MISYFKAKTIVCFNKIQNDYFEMNETVNKFLLTGDKFILELHLRQPEFTYSTCGFFTKHHKRIQKFKKTGELNYIYKNELDKTLCKGSENGGLKNVDVRNKVNNLQSSWVKRLYDDCFHE